MKNYVFTTRPGKGKRETDVNVYSIKENIPEFIGSETLDSASTKGEWAVALSVLYRKDEISKVAYCEDGGYYRESLAAKHGFIIHRIF